MLESAFFNPKSVRLTSKKLGLKTEASARFERGADVNAAVKGIERAIDAARRDRRGRARGGVIDEYPAPVAPRKIELRRARIAADARTGDPRCRRRAHSQRPGLSDPAASDAGWDVTVPTFRVDVQREVDLDRRGRAPLRLRPACRPHFRRCGAARRRPTRESSAIGSCGACCSRRAARKP